MGVKGTKAWRVWGYERLGHGALYTSIHLQHSPFRHQDAPPLHRQHLFLFLSIRTRGRRRHQPRHAKREIGSLRHRNITTIRAHSTAREAIGFKQLKEWADKPLSKNLRNRSPLSNTPSAARTSTNKLRRPLRLHYLGNHRSSRMIGVQELGSS